MATARWLFPVPVPPSQHGIALVLEEGASGEITYQALIIGRPQSGKLLRNSVPADRGRFVPTSVVSGVMPAPRSRSEYGGELVGVRGFEPPAPASRKQCSTRLSYTPPTEREL